MDMVSFTGMMGVFILANGSKVCSMEMQYIKNQMAIPEKVGGTKERELCGYDDNVLIFSLKSYLLKLFNFIQKN